MKNRIVKLSFSIIFGISFIFVLFTFYNTFSLEDGYLFDSDVYSIEDNYIMGISGKTDIELFYKYFELDNCSIEVIDKKGKKIKKGYVYNGSETLLYDHSGHVISRYRNVIYGDVNSDGVVDNKDLENFGSKLVSSEKLSDYQLKSIDLNLDGKAKINDLIEIDKLLNNSYQTLTLNYEEYTLLSGEELRLVSTVTPNKVLNQNLIWKSSDDKIAKVNDAGVVTAVSEGEAIITALTVDKKLSASVKIIVDDTVRLEVNEGYSYVNGEKVRVFIRSVDYRSLTCESSSDSASCVIEDDMLVVEPLKVGESVITVHNGEYGSVEYSFFAYKTFANVFPSYACISVNRRGEAVYSDFYDGEVIFEVTDKEIISDVYKPEDGKLVVAAGEKPGRAKVQIEESNGTMVTIFTLDVYDIRIPVIGGAFKVGEEFSADIVGGNFGTLECVSPDDTKVTCRIEDNKLIVKSLQEGELDIIVKNYIEYKGKNYPCGEAMFLAIMEE